MADTPSFTIDLIFEREQESIPGDWNIVDTYTQEYSFIWSETFSSRLDVQLGFDLEFEDIIRSLDVDEKHVIPSLDLDFRAGVWDLSLTVQDTIDFSNEFNTPRKDSLEFGVDLNLVPNYFPPFQMKVQRIIDTQDQLEDKVENKLDVSTDYSFYELFDVDMSWKEENTDDRLFDDSDIESREWDFNFDFSQAVTPSLKIDFQSGFSGGREDTLNNAGTILAVERDHLVDNALKFSVEAFPNITSDMEITSINDLADDEDEQGITWTLLGEQQIIELGTLTENLDVSRTAISSPTEDSNDDTFTLTVELAGTPHTYTDYSIKYELDLENLKDSVDPTRNRDAQDDEFNISVTLTPNEKVTLDTSYESAVGKESGAKVSTARNFKIEGTLEGAMLDIPNLTFTPKLEISTDNDIAAGTQNDILNLELGFLYAFVLGDNLSWEIDNVYKWKNEDSVLTRELDFDSDIDVKFLTPTWEFNFREKSSTTIEYDTIEPVFWTHEFKVDASNELTPMISFETSYEYSYEGDDDDTDILESTIEWKYRDTRLSLKAINERTFELNPNVLKTYEFEFSMEF